MLALIQEPVRYEIRKDGVWDSKSASFKLCQAAAIYDLVIRMKSSVDRRTEELEHLK